MDFYRKMWCVDCGVFIPDASILSHLTTNPDHGLIRLDHNSIGNPLVGPGGGMSIPHTGATYVDGGRVDSYTPDGSIGLPYKTIQAGLDACAVGGLVKVAKWEYVENVITVANKHIDADVGTLLRSTAGDTLTFTDGGPPLPYDGPVFMRGLNVQGEDPAGWTLRVRSLGTWNPFVAVFDNMFTSLNAANIIWCEGGGVYLTDAGGTSGGAPICCRVGRAGDTIGGEIITGRYNLNCAAGGTLFQIYEDGYVMADGASVSSDGPGAIIVDMIGAGSISHGCSFEMRYGRTQSDWQSFVRAQGSNCSARIFNDYGDPWGSFSGDIFDMPDGGQLFINDGAFSTTAGRVLRFGHNLPSPSMGNLRLTRVQGVSNGGYGSQVLEVYGNLFASFQDVQIEQNNFGASGTAIFDHGGEIYITGGSYKGPGPTIDQLNGNLWLLGGVDIIPTGFSIPGNIPIAVAMSGTLNRGHVNIRSGVPLIAGTENLLPSSFGEVEFGPAIAQAKQGAGTALPVGGNGYKRGSLFVLIPYPTGTPELYINTGSEAAPSWNAVGAGANIIRERAQLESSPAVNVNTGTYGSPAVMTFAGGVWDNPPFTNHGSGIVEVQQEGIYQLSFNLPFEAAVSFLVGSSPGACWYMSMDGGITWSPIVKTRTFDTTHGDSDDNGSLTLPPVEVVLAAGTRLRVGCWQNGTVLGGCWVNGYSGEGGVYDEAWARIERGYLVYDYTPSNPSNWDAPPPTTVASALDRLAAKLAIPPFVAGAGDPRVVPVTGYAGQIYKDTLAGIYYVCEADGTSTWGVL